MSDETTIDRFGRVVIPKKARDHFGLEPGAALLVEEREEGIFLKPAQEESTLRVKGNVLVFSGELTGDADLAVRRHREDRIRRFLPRTKR